MTNEEGRVAFMELSLADRAKIVAQYLSNKEGITQAQLGEKMGYSNRSWIWRDKQET